MRSTILLVIAALVAPTIAPAAEPDKPKAPIVYAAPDDVRKLAIRRYIAMWQTGSLDELTQVIGEGYVGHTASGDRDIGGLRARMTAFKAAYPDIRFTIQDQIAEGDLVATRVTAQATSAETGERVRMVGVNISRFSDGQIAEEWPTWERVSVSAEPR